MLDICTRNRAQFGDAVNSAIYEWHGVWRKIAGADPG